MTVNRTTHLNWKKGNIEVRLHSLLTNLMNQLWPQDFFKTSDRTETKKHCHDQFLHVLFLLQW